MALGKATCAAGCGVAFWPRRTGQRFCSGACRRHWWLRARGLLDTAGLTFACENPACDRVVPRRRRQQRFCSARCKMIVWRKAHPKPPTKRETTP